MNFVDDLKYGRPPNPNIFKKNECHRFCIFLSLAPGPLSPNLETAPEYLPNCIASIHKRTIYKNDTKLLYYI